jgi:hypothetical protein
VVKFECGPAAVTLPFLKKKGNSFSISATVPNRIWDGKVAERAGEPEDLPILESVASWIGPSKY